MSRIQLLWLGKRVRCWTATLVFQTRPCLLWQEGVEFGGLGAAGKACERMTAGFLALFDCLANQFGSVMLGL
jgi:hypothetical protein